MQIETYIINLKDRTDRYEHIVKEFENQNIFNINIVAGCKDEMGNIGLWKTIIVIIERQLNFTNNPFILICEDDHQFTNNYKPELLLECIKEAIMLEADILSGGVSCFETAIQISKNLFWVKNFSGFQFTVIFKNFYSKILNADFSRHDAADHKICDLSDKKFVIHPFVSTQKEFGYSDITPTNNESKHVAKLFEEASTYFTLLKKVRSYFLPDFK